MPTQDSKKDSIALRIFKKSKVITIEELAKLLSSSFVTARRRLKQWNTHTSYNHNGCYYALPTSTKFDANGLWRYKDVLFSQHGNLKKTVVALVKGSPTGLTGSQIGILVELAPRSFLSHFRNEPHLQREKIEGRFIYFSSDRTTRIQQKKLRQEEAVCKAATGLPTDAEAVAILVERIKHPDLSLEDFSKRLSKSGSRFSVETLRRFYGFHGLLKKKRDTPL